MPTDRSIARAQVAQRGLTAAAAERVVRVALDRHPVPLVARATSQLRRYFSAGPWTADDDAALAAAVGPADDAWFEEVLDADLTLGFGWRARGFRVEVQYEPAAGSDAAGAAGSADSIAPGRTLGDTFADAIVLEPGRVPTELRFGLGPGTGAVTTFTRENAASDTRVASLFDACADLEKIAIGGATITATIASASRWPDVLLALFDAVNVAFVPPRAVAYDRQFERARAELAGLHPDNPRELARILDATTSPDAAFRRVAIERLELADPSVALWPWTRGLEDSSRAMRRTTARVLAGAARAETRDLLERALGDADACVRYYAVRGLFGIGVGPSMAVVERRRKDPDVRVRLAVDSAVKGKEPA